MSMICLRNLTCLIGVSAVLLSAGATEAQDRPAGLQLALAGPSPIEGGPIEGGPVEKSVAAALERLVADGVLDAALATALGAGASPDVTRAVRAAYAQNRFRPIWTPEGAAALRRISVDLLHYGIPGDHAMAGDLAQLVRRRFGRREAAVSAKADLLLSVAWLRIAAAVSGGLADGRTAVATGSTAGETALTGAIASAGAGSPGEALGSFEPAHPQYRGLKTVLRRYREIRAHGGWAEVPDGDTLHPGNRDPRVPGLRMRLRAEGYGPVAVPEPAVFTVETATMPPEVFAPRPAAIDDPAVFDGSVSGPLRRFQASHGLEADGALGPRTLAALNETVGSKIARIVDAMVRWRGLDPGQRFVWANIPSFTVEGWNAGNREIAMRSIVGQPTRRTPVFSDQIEYAVANPRWYVPVSIAQRDKAPRLAAEPTYAARKGFAVIERSSGIEVSAWTVDWTDEAAVRRYRLVQAPGAGNALGELKILFPNRHSVYMHGTPDRALFRRASRAFSSGCVRLENPVAMAHWLTGHDRGTDTAAIDRALQSGERRYFRLAAPTPIHITYVTVTVADDGTAQFWRDIYDRGTVVGNVERYADLPADDGRGNDRITTASR